MRGYASIPLEEVERFKEKDAWYMYPWHDVPGGFIFPGSIVKKILSGETLVKEDWEKEFREVGLEFDFLEIEGIVYPSPSEKTLETLGLEGDFLEDDFESRVCEFESILAGYLLRKGVKVYWVRYGSELHKVLCDRYVMD